MKRSPTRREFVGAAAAGGTLLGLGDWSFLRALGPVGLAEARGAGDLARVESDVEPLVRLIEQTPPERVLEEVAQRIRRGEAGYRQVLAALLLAGVRNIQPRPSVGFKFHAVLVVNSAHLAAIAGPDEDRWLPIFWAIENYKRSEARDVQEGDWTMGPVDESKVPAANKAKGAFIEAMERWDVEAADAAVAALARSATIHEVYELFFRFGARDFRSIGHKAIYVANSYRTLQVIGWRYAEPVLRSLAYALLNHEGGPSPAGADLGPDRSWRHIAEVAPRLREDWIVGKVDAGATDGLLAAFREANGEQGADKAAEAINAGVSPASVWDAVFDAAGEWLLRQPGIVALHAATTANAFHQAYTATGDDLLRRKLLLQTASFMCQFRQAMQGRGNLGDTRIDQIEPAEVKQANAAGLDELFTLAGKDRPAAVRQALGWLNAGGNPDHLIDAARRLVFLKGNDAHDYKFTSAVLEDYHCLTAARRNAYLASSMMLLRSMGDRDSGLVERTRAAMGA